jgi:hypothetical protein
MNRRHRQICSYRNLDTEIIKLLTRFFSLHLAEYQPNLLITPPIFFLSICFHAAKILLLSFIP